MKKILFPLVLLQLIFAFSILGQVYKVDDFGAVGDGVTNDRDSIQAALDFVKANGGELQFTSGKTYLLAPSSNDDGLMRCGLNLYGHKNTTKITSTGAEKATLKIADGADVIWGNWIFRLYDTENMTISNLRFDGNRDNRQPEEIAGNYLLQIEQRCNGLRLENLEVKNGVVDNIFITSNTPNDTSSYITDFEMHNCVLKNAYRNNMSVIRGLNFKIIGCVFNNAHGTAPEAGIDFEPDEGGSDIGYQNMLVEGCTFKDNKRYGIMLTDISTENGYSKIKNNTFDNCGLFIASEYNVAKNNIFINLDHRPIYGGDDEERDGIVSFHVNFASNYNKVYNNYFYNNPTPSDMHLIAFMANSGTENEVFNNYEFNNSVTGFVNDTTGQIVYGNTSLNSIETGYWNMDSDSISGNSIFDLSDFGQTGTLFGNPSSVTGKINEALDFSGSNKYIVIPVKQNLNIEMNITLSAWIKWNGNDSENEQVIIGRNGDWKFSVNNSGQLGFYAPIKNDLSYFAEWTRTDVSISQNSWVLATVTYNGRETKIYIDSLEEAYENVYGKLDTSSSAINIASINGNSEFFNGCIDDVKIFNYALSREEVKEIFLEGTPYVLLETKIFLQGAYNSATNEMDINLTLPHLSPYSEDARTVNDIPVDVVDWILVQLRKTPSGSTIVSKSAFLRKDGRIISDDGSEQIQLNASEDNYYIVIKHRNHLAVMSSSAVSLNRTSTILYDFTLGEDKFYGK